MSEMQTFRKRAEEKRINRLNGRTSDEHGIVAHTDRWLQNLANLPSFAAHRRPLQDPETGLPYYIEGIHETIGGPDNAGLAPGTQMETQMGTGGNG